MKNISLRIDDQLHSKIEILADIDTRSINGQINVLLKEALNQRNIDSE